MEKRDTINDPAIPDEEEEVEVSDSEQLPDTAKKVFELKTVARAQLPNDSDYSG